MVMNGLFLGGQIINVGMRCNYAAGLDFPDEKFVYLEGIADGSVAGLLIGYENETSVVFRQLPTDGCKSVSTLVLPKTEEKCVVMVHNAATVQPDVVCSFGDDSRIFQNLESINPYKVHTIIDLLIPGLIFQILGNHN